MQPAPLHGFYLVNKPAGPSSAAVVGRLKYLLTQTGLPKKGPGRLVIGHGGTLDPLASGLLPIGIGKATKQLQALLEGPKTYQFTIAWGQQTTTDDTEGPCIARSQLRPTPPQIAAILPQFAGTLLQKPPIFSALKVGGARAYALARAGQQVSLEPRQVTIHSLQVIESDDKSATFSAQVSKGTYIRSLGRDIALALGTVGHITSLIRTAYGPFVLSQAVDFKTLDTALQTGDITAHLLPLAEPLAEPSSMPKGLEQKA
ncbi:MAG: tRNA pseudouridine(55) synthase TruB [Proteobacteria bacterium]|nr:tRNA pseudouridine(55) synthase TruB [Pseudomonadota bacterium]